MALVSLEGVPLTQVGAPTRNGFLILASSAGIGTIDAAGEAVIQYGQIWTSDGGSHTIDTTGSSSLGWRTAAVTFANAGTTCKVGLATIDSANGPPGRATNSTGTITFSVSKSMAGNGGGVTANAWQEHVPDAGTMTIANGDIVCFATQLTARAGADSIAVSAVSQAASSAGLPAVTTYLSSTFANATALPNAVITFSDGARGYFVGGMVMNGAIVVTTWNSGSATKEYGNYFKLPFPCKVHGITAAVAVSGNLDMVLYTDPLGTPAAQKTLPVLATGVAVSSTAVLQELFPSPYELAANQEFVLAFKPAGTNVTAAAQTFNSANHQESGQLGGACYAVNRATGAFSAQNSQKDRYSIGAMIQSFNHPARSGFALGM